MRQILKHFKFKYCFRKLPKRHVYSKCCFDERKISSVKKWKVQANLANRWKLGTQLWNAILWSTGTTNVDVKLYFQEETGGEELRLYGKNGKVVWKNKGYGKATKLILHDDGNLVMCNTCDKPTWDTGTYEDWLMLIVF